MSWNILRIFWTKDADLEHRETCFKQSERNTNENLNKIQQNFQKDMKDDYQRIPTRISNNFHRRVEWEKRKLHSVSKNCRNDIKESEKKIARVSTLVLAGVFRLHQVIKNTRQETEIKRKRIYMYIYIYTHTHIQGHSFCLVPSHHFITNIERWQRSSWLPDSSVKIGRMEYPWPSWIRHTSIHFLLPLFLSAPFASRFNVIPSCSE